MGILQKTFRAKRVEHPKLISMKHPKLISMKKIFASLGALGSIPYFITVFGIIVLVLSPLFFVIDLAVLPIAGVATGLAIAISALRHKQRHEEFKRYYNDRKEIKSLAAIRGDEYVMEEYDIPRWALEKIKNMNY